MGANNSNDSVFKRNYGGQKAMTHFASVGDWVGRWF